MNKKVVILVVLVVVLIGLAAYVLTSGGDQGAPVTPPPTNSQAVGQPAGVQPVPGVPAQEKVKPANALEAAFKAEQVKYDLVSRIEPPVLAERLAPPLNENGVFFLFDPFKDRTPVRRGGGTGNEPAPLDRLVEQFKLSGIARRADGKPTAFFRNVPLPFHVGDYLGGTGFKIIRIRVEVTPEERAERKEPEVEVENYQKQKYIFTLPSPVPPAVDDGSGVRR